MIKTKHQFGLEEKELLILTKQDVDMQSYQSISKHQELGDQYHEAVTAKTDLQHRCVSQNDNDLKHISPTVKNYLQKNNSNFTDWPAQSPNSNPIKNQWG